jgi:hypothetical protein
VTHVTSSPVAVRHLFLPGATTSVSGGRGIPAAAVATLNGAYSAAAGILCCAGEAAARLRCAGASSKTKGETLEKVGARWPPTARAYILLHAQHTGIKIAACLIVGSLAVAFLSSAAPSRPGRPASQPASPLSPRSPARFPRLLLLLLRLLLPGPALWSGAWCGVQGVAVSGAALIIITCMHVRESEGGEGFFFRAN